MDASKKHRVAVVGCGALAQLVHLPNVQNNPRMDLTAVCDINSVTAEQCRETFGAQRAETDWRKIVQAADIDLCILATHTNLRGVFIVPALEAGKPVYTEKPLAPDRAEMLDIVRAVRRTGVPVCVGHNRRSSPAVLELKRLLDKARAAENITRPSVDRGQVIPEQVPETAGLQILMRINDDIRSWKSWIFMTEEGCMFAEMVHFLDLALWFNRGHPIKIYAEGSQRGNFSIVLRFDDGSLTTIQHSFSGHFDYPKELIELSANQVTIAMDQHFEVRQCGMPDEPLLRTFPFGRDSEWAEAPGMTGYMRSLESERARATSENRPMRWLRPVKGHIQHLDRFLDHVEGRGENPCDVASAVPVNRLAMKALESVRLGLPVAIGPEDWHVASD